jgi:hypothetical protein
MNDRNKLECLYLSVHLVWSSLMFVGKAKSLPYTGAPWRLEMLTKEKHSSLFRTFKNCGCKKFYYMGPCRCQCNKTFFPLLLMMRPNKLECLYLAITFQSILTFASNTRSLPKKEASERSSNWVCSGLVLKV